MYTDRLQDLFYHYGKLETGSSFCLLRLEKIPDDAQGRHYYMLITTTIESAPAFETVSYVWCTVNRNVTISLRDGELLSDWPQRTETILNVQ